MTLPSSTSPSSQRRTILLRCVAPLVCAVLGLGFGALFLFRLDPEDHTRLRQIGIKQEALRRTSGAKRLLVCGDSSVAFGMDPTVLEAITGLPTVNLGYDANCGALTLLGVADISVQRGDVLVVSLVPNLFAGEPRPTRGGRLLAMLYRRPDMVFGGVEPLVRVGWTDPLLTYLSACTPGGHRIVNDAARPLLRIPGFRYQDCEIDGNGYYRGKVTLPLPPGYSTFPTVHAGWGPVLEKFVSRMQAQGVRVFYVLPWSWTPREKQEALSADGRRFLAGLAAIPILPEENLGMYDDLALFADTGVHLGVTGATMRSRALGESLNAALGQLPPPSAAP